MDDVQASASTFEELGVCKELCQAIKDAKWLVPTKIQREAIPVSLSGKDIIGLAETGSGKTGAFTIPILQDMLDCQPQGFFALVLSPTRELAMQIQEQFQMLGQVIGVKCAVLIGGLDMHTQARHLGMRPHVIIATPGRLTDHLSHTKGFHLRTIKHLVMDEADRILNMDFEKDINLVLKNIPKERRTYLFSATMTMKVQKLERASLRDPVKVEVSNKFQTVDTLTQYYILVPAKKKTAYLVAILHELEGSVFMVFCATCATVLKIAYTLRNLQMHAVPLSGQMSQAKRLGALNKFKSKDRSILVSTDVASRGLDIPHVDVVLNFDVPTRSKDYIHRVGRTARAGRCGKAVTMVSQYDVTFYLAIEQLLKVKLPQFPVTKDKAMLYFDQSEEAGRLAKLQMSQKDSKKRRKKGENSDEEDTEQSCGIRNKFKKRRKH